MKIDRIVILLMSLLFMVACAEQEDDFLSNPQDDGKLRLYITYPEGGLFNSTRAGNQTDPINDANPDNRVSSMRVMAFRMGEGGKKRMDKTLTVDKTNTNPSVPIEVPEGEYAFVVVCNQNADPDLAAKLDAVDNYQSLRAVQVKGDAFGNGKDIIMVGDSSENLVDTDNDGYGDAPRGLITINEAGLTTAPFNKFTVRVTRLASRLRFTVYTKQHNVAAGEKKVPELTKLEVTHLPGTMGVKGSNHAYDPTTTISLDGGIVSVPDITTDEVGKGYVTKQTIGRMIIPSSVTFSRENGAMVRAHFGAEGTEGAVVLEGVISYKPDGGGPQMYLLNPNAQYHITLAASPDNLKVAAEVEDWTVENLVGNVGKTYELDSDLKEVYIPYYYTYVSPSWTYRQINAKDILPIKVKFLVKSPPYKFKIVNDELGISQDVTMTTDEEVIDVNINITQLLEEYKFPNEVNEQFWGFKLPELDYLDYWSNPQKFTTTYDSYSLVKKFTFRLEEISAGGGAIQLPSVDYLPECVLPRDIYFISCVGSATGVISTRFANLQVNNNDPVGNFPVISSPYVHVPEAEDIDSAKRYCNNLGPDWKLAHKRNNIERPLMYYTMWLNKQWMEPDPSAPKDMYGWCEFDDGQDIVKVKMGSSYASPGNPVYPSPSADYYNPLFSSSLRDKKKHPICVIDKTVYSSPSVNTSLIGIGANFLIIDPSGKPYSKKEVTVAATFYNGTPLSYKWNYSADIKVSVKDPNSVTEHIIQQEAISSSSNEPYFSYRSVYDIYKPEYWSSDNWAGDAGGNGINVTLEASNAKCNTETATIDGTPNTFNVKRMQAYKTKDGKYYVEMDRNGQIETLHTPESAFGYTIPYPTKDHQVSDVALDGRPICEQKYGAGWMVAGSDMPIIYLKELNEAGVLRPGRIYYAGYSFYDQFWRWEKTWYGQQQVWYVRFFISAFDTNGFNDIQKEMDSSTWGYVHGMPTRGYVLCVKQIGR